MLAVFFALLLVAALLAGAYVGFVVRGWLADAPRLQAELEQLRAERELDRLAREATFKMLATVTTPKIDE